MTAPAPMDVRAWFDSQVALLRRKARRKAGKAERWKQRTPEAAPAAERVVEFAQHQLDQVCNARDRFSRLVDAIGRLPLTKTPYGLLVHEQDFAKVREALGNAIGEQLPVPPGEGGGA